MMQPHKYAKHLVTFFRTITKDDDMGVICAAMCIRTVLKSNPQYFTGNGTMLSAHDYFRDVRKEILKYSNDNITKALSTRIIKRSTHDPFYKVASVLKYASENGQDNNGDGNGSALGIKKNYVRNKEKCYFKYK